MTELSPAMSEDDDQHQLKTSSFSVVSTNIGPRVEVEIFGRRTLTAFAKHPVDQPLSLSEKGIAGDGHYEREGQEGRDHAVQICCTDNYTFWGDRLGKLLRPGAFGEAITYRGPDERSLRIGDILVVGSTHLQITSPRLPCAKLAYFLEQDLSFVKKYHQSLKTGIYARVLAPGFIAAGDEIRIELTDPMLPTVAEAAAILLDKLPDAHWLELLADEPRVSIMLRTMFAKKAQAVKTRQTQ